MRSFQRASTWLAAFVIGLPTLGVVAVIVALRGRSWELFAAAYLVLFVLAYLAGLILLALLRFRPDWLRALVAAVAVYAIASVTPLTDAMISYPYHVVRCGGLPVVGSFGAAPGYAVPGEEDYAVTPLDGSFFCTEKEARDLGYYHYAARRHQDAIARALKPVYTAPTEAAALERFYAFAELWGGRYPATVKLWEDAWAEVVPFLTFDTEIRRVICSTNAIEPVSARIWRAVFEGRLTPATR